MAKKKQDKLNYEDKLQAALVPDWEWPYKVPSNWVWTMMPHICESIKAGGDKPTNVTDTKNNENTIPIVANGITNDGVIGFTDIAKAEKNTITISARGTIGYAVIRDYEYYPVVRIIVIKPYKNIIPKLIKYFFDNFLEEGTGSSIPQLTVPMLSNKFFPLPPLAEQQRIVERIDRLFAKLDEAKALAQSALDSFETRKATILHKAFTGELTKKWRQENGVNLDSWGKKEIGAFCFVTKLAGFEYTKNIAPNLCNIGIPLFKGKNVQKGELVLKFESYIPKHISDQLIRSKLTKKCLLAPYVGTIGNIAIFDGSFEAHLGSNVGKIEILDNKTSTEEFLLYYLRSEFGYAELIKEKKATAQESISIQAIRNIAVILPEHPEQTEIVRILDSIFVKEQDAKELVNVIEKIDLMKKAILARAFRGELGTNNPNEESAMELLKEILKGK